MCQYVAARFHWAASRAEIYLAQNSALRWPRADDVLHPAKAILLTLYFLLTYFSRQVTFHRSFGPVNSFDKP
jgi:hypothetical protein